MCTVAEGFSTLTGTKEVLDEVEHQWTSLDSVRFNPAWPYHNKPKLTLRVATLERLHRSLGHPHAPRVALIRHENGSPPGVGNQLQAELLLRGLPVICEAGYHFALGGGSTASAEAPTVWIDPQMVAAATTGELPAPATGNRVALLDTGDIGGNKPTMVDLTGGQLIPDADADDLNGHGTAIASLIRAIAPKADVWPVRVVDADLATSYQLLCGLAYALWSEQFDIVNVSLSAHTPGGCATMLGTSLEMILRLCRQNGVRLPAMVAAAGNTLTGQSFGYPAKLPGALVVQAWDWSGNPSGYNVSVPDTASSVYASGGEPGQPFGHITTHDQAQHDIFGTSFAAAVVTASLL
ncbi:S8/S53 family peptidase [Amycolatopsis sp. NPDC024027]|uniref:S8/S53 family peptidase n=1 Tax=Amycolatopsis sp. NPDC024027 TaxID=3154327 RepID=UPI0033D46E94